MYEAPTDVLTEAYSEEYWDDLSRFMSGKTRDVVRDAGMGRLVQSSASTRTHRLHAAGRSRRRPKPRTYIISNATSQLKWYDSNPRASDKAGTGQVLSWRLFNKMDVGFWVDALERAIIHYGYTIGGRISLIPIISQFTSTDFTDVLKRETIQISMDGNGRWMGNVFIERLWRSVKYE